MRETGGEIMKHLVRMLAPICLIVIATTSQAQDCSKPKSNTERLICSNDRVGQAHELMAAAFLFAFRRAPADDIRDRLRREQREWEVTVRDPCGDVPCLLRAYQDRTLDLQQN